MSAARLNQGGRMRSNMRVIMAALAALQAAHAFNPIHESSYNLEPRGNFSSATTLSMGAILDSRNTDVFDIPASVALKVGPRMEIGAGLKTRWGEVDDHVPYLVFGVKWLTLRHTSFQADLLVGANVNTGKGFSLASHHRFTYTDRLYSRFAARLGFMEALVENDALMAFETGFYPGIILMRPLSFELGLIGSSQTRDFEPNLAMDLEPALIVRLGHDSMLETGIGIGLAGDRKEEMRVKVTLNYGF
jgi:hypothetical protein